VHRKICATAASLLTLTACAPAASAPSQAAPAPTRTTTTSAVDCTRATKVAITGADAFSPARLTIRRGDVLAMTNKSGHVHALASTPDAGIVTSVLDLKERQFIQFPKEGVFTVRSSGATLRVTVAGESGCGAPKPTLTLTAGDGVSPARLSVVATENFTVVNKSGAARTVRCSPDPGSNRDNSRLESDETQILAIDKPGTYACGNATITVKAR
jgi:plastocyanin